EKLGGMTKAVESGMPKQRIEAAAARRQALIDQGEEVIVGSNKYQAENSEPVEVREIDNNAVRKAQIRRLNTIRKNRDTQKVDYALNEITSAAETGKGNLLALSIEAMRVRATVGEVSAAMEKIWGRYNAPIQSISGVYAKSFSDQKEISSVREEINSFAKNAGRRPRIMVAKMGQDGHDRGAKVIATAFADLGFDVDIAPLFQTPEEVVKQAIENDVHVIGISSQAAGHKTLIELLMKVLEKENSEDIVVVAGGVIPPHDYAFLKDLGVACIFGPGTPIPGAAREVLAAISNKI
ncbi:MAG TPA: methylmalonyl-CoA mutase, partial [Candidatus Lambdaproteobacteria bacterium]|nr:methylmalonyl-CoA mutase [Candidatus Lambdaproteobacteria bacterium]